MRRNLAVGAMALALAQGVPTSTHADPLPPADGHPVPTAPAAQMIGLGARARLASAALRASVAIRSAALVDDTDMSAIAKLKRQQAISRAKIAAAKRLAAHRKAVAAAKARASRAAARRKALLTPAYVWAHRSFSIAVANCESGGGPTDHHSYYDGNAHLNDPNGHYGKWQFDFPTWREVGGSGNPANYSEAVQDRRAYDLWKANGWGRWECARIVG